MMRLTAFLVMDPFMTGMVMDETLLAKSNGN